MKILIKNGRVIDPANGIDKITDIYVENGVISEVGADPDLEGVEMEVIDASGMCVAPGLVDMHVHLREPGQEYKEDIESGTLAAAFGGVTSVACMPNTDPVVDNEAIVSFIKTKAEEVGYVNVFPIGAVSKGLEGKYLAEIGEMVFAGAVAVSDDGMPVVNSGLMRRAIEYSEMFDIPVISHCEDPALGEGDMNEGAVATSMGLRGISRAAEEVMAARDILVAEAVGGRVHIAHISTRGTVDIIRKAKERGVRVTCETCPHYFSLTEEACLGFNTNAKMNPPLRTADDVEAIKEGLKDGTIDCIVTDHAPHHPDEKNCEFAAAKNGIVGLETSLGLGIKNLVKTGVLTMSELIEKMSVNPSQILGISKGSLGEGKCADIVIFDPDKEWTVDITKLHSKGKNSPYDGFELYGKPEYVIVGGEIVINRGELMK
ncbi:MAG TPA: dihydroorotase [Candidatus Ornithomonoglobus merdipullorum]|uniref:Dihydroorotase n=1 Tax=Candidatus Ornithomonoglobus merdipullorum TaxID=2840895 RepID=A0A9D1SEE6_9FIRM|nr:dihydroorotase [Candidatus Ornithomonoglobus merdipullorum]